jgi:hypothetical protein
MPKISSIIHRIWTWGLVLGLMSSAAYSQSSQYQCKLVMADLNKDDASTLGEFSVSSGKQGYEKKAFRLPTSDLFVNSAVFLRGELGAKDDALPTKMYLILAIGRKEYSRIESEMKDGDVRTNAMTRANLTGTRNIEVSTTFLGRPEPVILTLECRN